jgi:hypothetical protein
VLVGDSQVPQSAISVVIEGAGANASLRVSTAVPMTEPLVVVSLTAGCTVRVNRRFTLFADPPGHRVMPVVSAPPPVAAPAAAPVTQTAAVVAPTAPLAPPTVLPLAPSAANLPPPTPAAPAPVAAPTPVAAPASPAPAAPVAAAKAPAKAAPPPASKAAPKPAPKVATTTGNAKAGAEANKAVAKPAVPPGSAKTPAPAAGSPSLKLEAPRISSRVIDAAAAAEREAALRNAEEAAIAAKAAAEAAEARASQLERSIALLQQESKANREALLRLTQAMEETGGKGWSQALMAAVVGLLGLTGFLLYRLRRLQTASAQAWLRVPPEGGALEAAPTAASAGLEEPDTAAPSQSQPRAPGDLGGQAAGEALPAISGAPGLSGETALQSLGEPESPASPLPSLSLDVMASSLGADQDTPLDRTQLLPPSAVSVSPPIRAVSIEELLDLEQQVEFYTVLGQDDAALALLVEHLRHTGGTYPLPFLKLMELYRRKGDADAYERTRDRFNQRFNAVAPAWGAPPTPERGLDEYPEVMRQIQQAWLRPVDATAMLENMLFRTQGSELFDLSALADVLFLFTLARDLLENESGEATTVDVLLPFDESGGSEADRVPLMEVPSRSAESAPAREPTPPRLPQIDLPLVSMPSLAATTAAAAAPLAGPVSADSDLDIDIPLGEPMLEPLFSQAEGGGSEPVSDAGANDALVSSAVRADRSAQSLDFEFGIESIGVPLPAAASNAVAAKQSLDFDMSDFDLPIATVTPVDGRSAPPPSAEPLDLNIDDLSLESTSPRRPVGEDGSGKA